MYVFVSSDTMLPVVLKACTRILASKIQSPTIGILLKGLTINKNDAKIPGGLASFPHQTLSLSPENSNYMIYC